MPETHGFIIRDADIGDVGSLSALAERSKAHWGYDADFMAACMSELTVPASSLASEVVRLCERNGRLAGFYRLECANRSSGLPSDRSNSFVQSEIEGFFVDPEYIGSGAGRALWSDLVEQAVAHGISRIICQSDPHAEGFYAAMGMQRIGVQPSASIPGRELPVLEYRVPSRLR